MATASNDVIVQEMTIPEVLTTTRLRQPKSRVPGSTTVIDGDTIRDLGIMNLVEVFRLVPGMTVAEVGSNNPVTSYHGTVHYEQRRMQVLVDGRTAFRPTLADMEWNTMPVPLELIERIEVARGPNSAAYGINAFLGTINIITRTPADSAGRELRIASGSRGHRRAFASVAEASEDYDWRLSYEKRKSDGFDDQTIYHDFGDPYLQNFHDGYDINTFQYDSVSRLSNDFNIEFRSGVVDGTDEEDRFKSAEFRPLEHPDIDVRDYYLQARVNGTPSADHYYHLQVSFENFKRRQRWPVCIPEGILEYLDDGSPLNPEEVEYGCDATGAVPVFAQFNKDQEDSRLDLEYQDTMILNPGLKLVSGLGYRKDSYQSETHFNGKGNLYQARAFGNVEYSPFNWLTLNGGGNWEKTTTTDDHYFSPRVASNFILNRNHTLRLVYSEAVRTPDVFEQSPDYSYRLHDADPARWEGFRIRNTEVWAEPDLITFGRELEEERITSREISYFGQFRLTPALVSLEVRYFNDQLRDMVSGVIQFDNWTLDNNVALDQEGFEVEASLDYPGTRLRMSYAYLDQDGWYTGQPDYDEDEKDFNVELLGRLSVRHSGSLAWIQQLPFGLKSSAAFYFADEFRWSQFERADFRLAKQVFQSGYSYELAFTMQHYLNDEPELSSDNLIRERNQFFVEGGVQF